MTGHSYQIPDVFREWIDKNISKEGREIFESSFSLFLGRFSPFLINNPDGSMFLRLYKSAAWLQADGHLRTSENFIIPEVERFHNDSAYRMDVIRDGSWDDAARFFSQNINISDIFSNNDKTRFIYSVGQNENESSVWDMMRHFEYYLNSVLRKTPTDFLDDGPGLRYLSPKIKSDFIKTYCDYYKETASLSYGAFKQGFNPLIVDVIQKSHANNVNTYNWLAGKKQAHQANASYTIDLAVSRLQAAQSYPVLLNYFKSPRYGLQDIIENGESLADALGTMFGFSRRSLKMLRNIPVQSFPLVSMGVPTRSSVCMLSETLSRYPERNEVLETARGWSCYFLLDRVFKGLGYALSDAEIEQIKQGTSIPLMSEAMCRYSREQRESFYASWFNKKDAGDVEHSRVLSNFLAEIDLLHNNLFVPLWVSNEAEGQWSLQDTIGLMMKNKDLNSVIDTVKFLQDNNRDILLALQTRHPKKEEIGYSWEPLHDKQITCSGYTFTSIASSMELLEEGNRVNNCVGGYAPRCMFHREHVISVRKKDDAEVLTLSLKHDDLKEYVFERDFTLSDLAQISLPAVIEFRGYQNSEPTLEAYKALGEYLVALSNPNILKQEDEDKEKIRRSPSTIDLNSIEINMMSNKRMLRNLSESSLSCVYHISGDALKDAWRYYRDIIPKAVRKNGLNAMMTYKQDRQKRLEDIVIDIQEAKKTPDSSGPSFTS